MTLLTTRELFTEIRYADPATASAYPPDLTLTVTAPGRLDTTILGGQELKVGDLLIRSTETTHPLTRPRDVRPGDTAILSTDGGGATPSRSPRAATAAPNRTGHTATRPHGH